jgi:hypothetical protein
MHTLGSKHLDELRTCDAWKIPVIEDAESIEVSIKVSQPEV